MEEQKRSREDIELINKAYDFSLRAHQGQKRKSGEPYIIHPLTTAYRIAEMRLDSKTIAAAFLHDVLEDYPEKEKELKKEFGEEISFLVEGVTKLNKIKYRGAERSAESLRKMFLAIGEDIRIVLLKLTDRLHNVETLQYLPPEKQKRIAQETMDIYAPLAYRLGMENLSGELEDLCFPFVYPREHEWLVGITRQRRDKWSRLIQKMKPILAEELMREKIKFLSINSRVKHYYSIYKKLHKFDMDIAKITDLVAMRVIVPSVDDCYAALGVVHKLWPPVPGKIKDYIALPKPNGYQSLHTTVFTKGDGLVEIQMRTPEMHEEAEYGIAAHWAYAEQKREKRKLYAHNISSFLDQKKFSWLRQIREWQKEVKNPDEFLESLKIDFFQSRIFVLSPKGDVVDLPEGSTPVDFAFHIHTDIGQSAQGAKVNNKMVPLHHQLKTGDMVEILTQKGKKPSSDWLKFVKSSEARRKISSILKKMEENKNFAKQSGENMEIKLSVRNRVGMLRDISSVFARQKNSIKNISMETKNRIHPVVVIQTSFKNRRELEKIMVKLKEIKGVEEAEYKISH